MLLHSFFEIEGVKEDEFGFLVDIKLQKNHPVYKGHFPDQPVAPGVFLIQMFVEILGELTNKNLRLESSANTKFTAIVDPNENPNMQVLVDFSFLDDETIKSRGILTKGDKKFFSIQGKFKVHNE